MNAVPTLRVEIELEPPWLQPIVFPAAAYLEYAQRMNDSLAEFERRFAPPMASRPAPRRGDAGPAPFRR